MADELVLDAPELETLDTSAEETAEPIDPAGDPDDASVAETTEPTGDNRTLPQYIRNMKESDPQGYKDAKALFFSNRATMDKLKDFDLDGTRSWLEENGGREGFMAAYAEREQKSQAMDNVEAALQNGSPELVKMMASSSPEGFAKLAPEVMAEWGRVAPEEYSKAVYGALNSVVAQMEVPSLFDEKQGTSFPSFLAEVRGAMFSASPEQKAQIGGIILSRVEQMFNGIKGAASAPVQQRQAAQGNQPNVQQERNAWEMEKFTDGLKADEDKQRTAVIESELASFIAKRPKDTDAKDLAMSTLASKVQERMAKDADYQSKRKAFLDRKDKDGALKLAKSRETLAIKEIAPGVGKAIYGTSAAPKPTTPAGSRPTRAFAPPVSRDPHMDILRRAMER